MKETRICDKKRVVDGFVDISGMTDTLQNEASHSNNEFTSRKSPCHIILQVCFIGASETDDRWEGRSGDHSPVLPLNCKSQLRKK